MLSLLHSPPFLTDDHTLNCHITTAISMSIVKVITLVYKFIVIRVVSFYDRKIHPSQNHLLITITVECNYLISYIGHSCNSTDYCNSMTDSTNYSHIPSYYNHRLDSHTHYYMSLTIAMAIIKHLHAYNLDSSCHRLRTQAITAELTAYFYRKNRPY